MDVIAILTQNIPFSPTLQSLLETPNELTLQGTNISHRKGSSETHLSSKSALKTGRGYVIVSWRVSAEIYVLRNQEPSIRHDRPVNQDTEALRPRVTSGRPTLVRSSSAIGKNQILQKNMCIYIIIYHIHIYN